MLALCRRMRKGTSSVISGFAVIVTQVLIQRLVNNLAAMLTCRSFILGHRTRRLREIELCECAVSKQYEYETLTSAVLWVLPEAVVFGPQALKLGVLSERVSCQIVVDVVVPIVV